MVDLKYKDICPYAADVLFFTDTTIQKQQSYKMIKLHSC